MEILIPSSMTQICEFLAENPDRQLLAGGTDFMVEVNYRHREPHNVIAIDRVPELRRWRHEGDTVIIGSCVTYREIERGALAALVPALAQAARTVGSPQIRNAATIGGNIATASPAGDMLPVLTALGATVTVRSLYGERNISLNELIVGVKKTSLQKGEFIEAIQVPVLNSPQEFLKVGVRSAMVISIASLALITYPVTKTVGIGIGAVNAVPTRAREAETFIRDHIDWEKMQVNFSAMSEFRNLISAASSPIDDHRSSAAYRRHSIGVLGERALLRIFGQGGTND
ncbi:MAG: FAD binding domain-containing protein [Acidimicrobiales bacterium]|nr:FAD binding domain-containing protein [Acidimicrobiales bacterium]